MTLRQKRIIAALAIANGAVILAMILFVVRSPKATGSANTSPASTSSSLALDECEWRAAQLLAQADLGGTVELTSDGMLRFKLFYKLAPAQAPDVAAQQVWAAFDIALALESENCAFSQVEVSVMALRPHEEGLGQRGLYVEALVSAADLTAFGTGELSEGALIDQVVYKSMPLP